MAIGASHLTNTLATKCNLERHYSIEVNSNYLIVVAVIGKGMTATSMRRVFGEVKAINSLAIREHGLTRYNMFGTVFIPDDEKAFTRLPIPDENLLGIQKGCVELNDDVRWLVALISDTGMRLAEAAGLLVTGY